MEELKIKEKQEKLRKILETAATVASIIVGVLEAVRNLGELLKLDLSKKEILHVQLYESLDSARKS